MTGPPASSAYRLAYSSASPVNTCSTTAADKSIIVGKYRKMVPMLKPPRRTISGPVKPAKPPSTSVAVAARTTAALVASRRAS